jgi:hypothetical protein
MPLGAFRLNSIARYIVSGAPALGDYGLWRVLDNPNAYSTSSGDQFGQSVAVSENYYIVGTREEDDVDGTQSGKAYIYSTSTGELLHTLNNPNPYDTSFGDQFGSSVSISNNYAIVGAPGEQAGFGTNTGKAYIYSTTTGSLLYTLDSPVATFGVFFGQSVGITNTHAIVGAYGVTDAGVSDSGKAYIYSTSTGSLLYTLDNPNAYSTSANDNFGCSVSISNDYAIVGARFEDDAGGSESGKAYIFDVSDGSLLYTLDNPNAYSTSDNDRFGHSVSISNTHAIVGAFFEDDANGSGSGKAYIYSTSTGELLHTLNNPNPYDTGLNDNFGELVAISDNYAIVGTYQEDDAVGLGVGKAYIYSNSTGELLQTLDNPNSYSLTIGDQFAWSVGITDNYAIIGSRLEDDAGGQSSGKAYLYTRVEDDHITPSSAGIVYRTFASSTATTITIPALVQEGDLLVLADTSTTVTDVTPSGWTSISKVTTTGIRTNVSYKIAGSGDAGTSVTGMAGTTRKIMSVHRNVGTNSLTVDEISTPSAQATTAAPSNQTITGGTKPCIYFAVYGKTASTVPTRGFTGLPTGLTAQTNSSISTSGVYLLSAVFDAGVNEHTVTNVTISMTDAGTNTLQSFRINLS